MELVQGGTGGLSVLRTFRLLRILKLVRFMPQAYHYERLCCFALARGLKAVRFAIG